MNSTPARIGRTVTAVVVAVVGSGLVLTSGPASASVTTRNPVDTATFQADLDAVTAAGAVGIVGAVSGRGVNWAGAAGDRTINDPTAARQGDTTRVASVTKAMVATLVMQEVQAGRWTLNTTVGDVLPGLLPGHGGVTLEQLLSHRSGIPDYFDALLAGATTPAELIDVASRHYTDQRLVAAALTLPWLFAPGTDFSYSNTGYVVVTMMLERATGLGLGQLLERRVFGPAGMGSSSFQTDRLWGDPQHLSEYAVMGRPYNVSSTSPTIFSGAGAVQSTARDLDRFYTALFAGRLVGASYVEQMLTPRTADPAYGLGIYALVDPCPAADGSAQLVFGHDGASFGTLSIVFISADGTRRVSESYTGRQLVAQPTTTAPANQFLVDALTATCPRAVPADRSRTAQRQLGLRGFDTAALRLAG